MSRDRARDSANRLWNKRAAEERKQREAEVWSALRGLAEYAGGSDAPPGHPCRTAWDTLRKYETQMKDPA